jgi:hypothetical protein
MIIYGKPLSYMFKNLYYIRNAIFQLEISKKNIFPLLSPQWAPKHTRALLGLWLPGGLGVCIYICPHAATRVPSSPDGIILGNTC